MTLIVVSDSFAFIEQDAKRSARAMMLMTFFIFEYFNVDSCTK